MVVKTAFNPNDTPVVVDADGHTVGGHEWGTVETTEVVVSDALDAGRLVLVDVDAGASDLAPQALEAARRTVERSDKTTTTSRAKGAGKEE